MLKVFMRLVFGGQSNKREATLFAFLVSVAWVSFILWKVGQGVDMSSVIGLATTVTVITFTGLASTTTLDFLGRQGVLPGQGGDAAPGRGR